MNVLCRNFILSDFCQIGSSFFCFFRALSVGTPTFIIEPLKLRMSFNTFFDVFLDGKVPEISVISRKAF